MCVWNFLLGIRDFLRRSNYDRRQSFAAETVALEHSVVRNNSQFLYAGLGDEEINRGAKCYLDSIQERVHTG